MLIPVKYLIVINLAFALIGAIVSFSVVDNKYQWEISKKQIELETCLDNPVVIHDTVQVFVPQPINAVESVVISAYYTGWTIGRNSGIDECDKGLFLTDQDIVMKRDESVNWYRRRVFNH